MMSKDDIRAKKWLDSLPRRVLIRVIPVLTGPFGDPFALSPMTWRLPEEFGPIGIQHLSGRFWSPRTMVPIVPNRNLQTSVEFVFEVYGERDDIVGSEPLDE